MMTSANAPVKLKGDVHNFWNRESCGVFATEAAKHTKEYFDEIEAFRYWDQPFIHEFAQFTRYHGKKVLEVGFGAGTDFTQWLRAGAKVSGIDLTEEALENLRRRIEVFQLPQPEYIGVGDAEKLTFPDNTFDLGYSFGVLHHSPNTEQAISELVRVVRPGGEVKIMVYNRRCLCAFKTWIRYALLRGKPWKSVRWALWHHMESPGTKGYTALELKRIFEALPLQNIQIHFYITSADYVAFSAFKPLNLLIRALIRLAGYHHPWRREDFLGYVNKDASKPGASKSPRPRTIVTGNPLGFFVCITATKQ